jgi:hypothetical protein
VRAIFLSIAVLYAEQFPEIVESRKSGNHHWYIPFRNQFSNFVAISWHHPPVADETHEKNFLNYPERIAQSWNPFRLNRAEIIIEHSATAFVGVNKCN